MVKAGRRKQRCATIVLATGIDRLNAAGALFDQTAVDDEKAVACWRESARNVYEKIKVTSVKGYNPICDGISAHAFAALLKLDTLPNSGAFTFACEMLSQSEIAPERIDDVLVRASGIDGLIDWLCVRGAALLADDPDARVPDAPVPDDELFDMPSWAVAESMRAFACVLPLSEALANTLALHPKWDLFETTVVELVARNFNRDVNSSVRLFLQNQMLQHSISKALLKTALKRSGLGARLLSTVVNILDALGHALATGDMTLEEEANAAIAQISAMFMNSLVSQEKLSGMWARALCEAQAHRALLNIVHFDKHNSLSVVAMRVLMDVVSTLASECPESFNAFLSGGHLPGPTAALKKMLRYLPVDARLASVPAVAVDATETAAKDKLEDAVLVASEEAALADFQLLVCVGEHYPDAEVRHFAFKGVARMHQHIASGDLAKAFERFIVPEKCHAPRIIEGDEEGTVKGVLQFTEMGAEHVKSVCKERGWKGKYKFSDGGRYNFSTESEKLGAEVYLRGGQDRPGRLCATCHMEETKNETRFKACSGCNAVWYCSSQCQEANWKLHKKTCPRHDKQGRK